MQAKRFILPILVIAALACFTQARISLEEGAAPAGATAISLEERAAPAGATAARQLTTAGPQSPTRVWWCATHCWKKSTRGWNVCHRLPGYVARCTAPLNCQRNCYGPIASIRHRKCKQRLAYKMRCAWDSELTPAQRLRRNSIRAKARRWRFQAIAWAQFRGGLRRNRIKEQVALRNSQIAWAAWQRNNLAGKRVRHVAFMVYVRAYRWAWWEFYLTYRAYWYAARKFTALNTIYARALKELQDLRDSGSASEADVAAAARRMNQANYNRTLWWRTVFNDKRQTAATARTLLWRIAAQRPKAHVSEDGKEEEQEDDTDGEAMKDLDEGQVVENPAADLEGAEADDDNEEPVFADEADDELCDDSVDVCDLGEDEGVEASAEDNGAALP